MPPIASNAMVIIHIISIAAARRKHPALSAPPGLGGLATSMRGDGVQGVLPRLPACWKAGRAARNAAEPQPNGPVGTAASLPCFAKVPGPLGTATAVPRYGQRGDSANTRSLSLGLR